VAVVIPTNRRLSRNARVAFRLLVCCSVVVSRPLVVSIYIGSLLFDVRLAIRSIRKSAAANLSGLAYCVPAIIDPSPIGFRFLNKSWS
jgi:hypothetical protein